MLHDLSLPKVAARCTLAAMMVYMLFSCAHNRSNRSSIPVVTRYNCYEIEKEAPHTFEEAVLGREHSTLKNLGIGD